MDSSFVICLRLSRRLGCHSSFRRRRWFVIPALFVLALLGQWYFVSAFEVPPKDEPDSQLYLALAHNLLVHGEYTSHSGPEPVPHYLRYIRLPGYPWLITGVFALCGDGNLDALRAIQALLSTLTATLVGGLAFLWEPGPARRFRAALAAFGLAAVCPFTAIYGAVIQAEALTMFLAMGLVLVATLAFRASAARARTGLWLAAGVLAGAAQLVRPESGLFAAAIGFTLVGSGLWGNCWSARAPRWGWLRDGAVFSGVFVVMLVPWTLHNARVLHVYSPLPPASAVPPGENDFHGFHAWYRTWADSERYLQPVYWAMSDGDAANLDDLPPGAFDSPAERARTAGFFGQYNAPAGPDTAAGSTRAGLTPELDAAFGQLGRERALRSPWRYCVVLPFWRAVGLWFVPHAQYYDFEGSLFPSSQMPDGNDAPFWLPVFFALTCLYTALGLAGAWWLAGTPPPFRADAWRWLGLVILIVLPRWLYLAALENTEPRYMVEIFPLLCVLGGLALAGRRARMNA